jgi:hypothetical protein
VRRIGSGSFYKIKGGRKIEWYVGERSGQRPKMKRTGSARIVLLVLLVGLITFEMNAAANAAEKGPIKIGFIAPLTGGLPVLEVQSGGVPEAARLYKG